MNAELSNEAVDVIISAIDKFQGNFEVENIYLQHSLVHMHVITSLPT